MDETVPPATADKITQLKDALSHVSDAALACANRSVSPIALEKQLAQILHANAPEPASNKVISNNDHRYDEIFGSYGHNLRVKVSRPPGFADILAIQYSINIECGADTMLLVYGFQDGTWVERLRWQSPPLKQTSDAFGDFFVSAYLRDSSASESRSTRWLVAVAHGTPWCTSRFSGFKIDLLSPGRGPASPLVLWHTQRAYSRGDFEPWIKSSGNTFELRLNADCMSFDLANCFERRVIYRYTVDSNGRVRRVGPLAINARGFVEEWLSAPWSEARDFSIAGAAPVLQKVHDQFNPPFKLNDDQFVSHSLGPVRACVAPGTFQIQINSSLVRTIPGKPGGESKALASRYFQVHAVKNGYIVVAAPTAPDPKCAGPDLMRSDGG
ncbi:MAG: hypothetical protein WA700_09755 [Acidobacteriaceae bacterium]